MRREGQAEARKGQGEDLIHAAKPCGLVNLSVNLIPSHRDWETELPSSGGNWNKQVFCLFVCLFVFVSVSFPQEVKEARVSSY